MNAFSLELFLDHYLRLVCSVIVVDDIVVIVAT